MLSCGNRAGTWSGEEPEPKHQPFCRHSCCGMPQSMHLLVGMGCWRHSALSGVSCADAMKVEGRQCLHPAWLTVFGNKTALSRRLLFYPCLVQWVSVLSLLTLGDCTSDVGCFSEATSNLVIWTSGENLRDLSILRKCVLGSFVCW